MVASAPLAQYQASDLVHATSLMSLQPVRYVMSPEQMVVFVQLIALYVPVHLARHVPFLIIMPAPNV